MDASNVFNILLMAQKYEEKDLNERCWEVIDNKSQAATKSDGFMTIEHSLLEAVVSRDTLTINEIELFKAVDLWATKKCGSEGLEANGEEKRRILGEKVVKAIRFPVMKLQEFASVVPDTNILTPGEVINFFKFFSSALAAPSGFSKTKRSGSRATSRVRGSRDQPWVRVSPPSELNQGVTFGAPLQPQQPYSRFQQQNASADLPRLWQCPECHEFLPFLHREQHMNIHRF